MLRGYLVCVTCNYNSLNSLISKLNIMIILTLNMCTIQEGGGGGGGGTVIFSYIRRLGSFLWFKILNFNIYWGFSKK